MSLPMMGKARPRQSCRSPIEVVGGVHANDQPDEPPRWAVYNVQLPPPVARAKPPVADGGKPELAIVGNRLGDVRHADGNRAQAMQCHASLLRTAYQLGHEPVTHLAHVFNIGDQFVTRTEEALRMPTHANARRGSRKDHVARQQRCHLRQGLDEQRYGKDELGRTAFLDLFAVYPAAQLEIVRVGEPVDTHQPRTDWAESRIGLPQAELR